MPAARQRLIAAILCVVLAGLYAASARPTLAADPVLVGAGDIADCTTTTAASSGAEQTAKLLDNIAGSVFTLGDNAYPAGAAADFTNCYNPTWGRHKLRTNPIPGNHDYDTSSAAPYFSYFGASAGTSGKGYYSYNLGTWHIVALNTEIDASASSVQAQWLRDDLAANPATCTLALWHEPLYSSGQHGNLPLGQELWKILHQAGADVVLNGHDHDYERFAPQDAFGRADPNGIRAFVVGTGGAGLRGFSIIRPNSEARDSATFGVLKLTLHAGSYDWLFVPVAGKTFTDTGTASCYNGSNPTATPTSTPTPLPPGQSILTFNPSADAYVDQAAPTMSFTTNSQLLAVGGTAKQSFLRFNVAGLPAGATITSAQLRLYVVNQSVSGGIFNAITNTSWPETITWNSQPAIDGPQLAALGAITAGTPVTIDVSSVVTGNGAYSFAISSPPGNGDTLGYSSREAAIVENRPQLVITTQTGPVPTLTPTLTPTFTPTASPTLTPTATLVPTPTFTPSPTLTPTTAPDNPAPAIDSLSPGSAAASSGAFTLSVLGSGFVAGSVVRWNGADRPTTFVSATSLTASIPAADLSAAGSAAVTVFTPAPGGGTSNSQTFTITPALPPNLLANGGFELDANNDTRPDSWTSSARFTRSTTLVHAGSFAGKLAATDNSAFTIMQQVNNLVAGQSYSFASAVNIPATPDAFSCKLEIRWRNAAGTTLRTDALKTYSAATGGAWDLISTRLAAAPANTNNAQVRIVLSSLNAAIYIDDFALQADAAPADTTPPHVTAQSPAPGAANAATGTTVKATFDEPVAGVSGTTFTLADSSGATVPANVSYDATSRTATLAPASALNAGASYTARLTSGIADTAGNPLASVNWSFGTLPVAGGTTLAFGAAADTYVSQASPTAAAGTSSSVSIVGGTTTEKQAFLRFIVSGLPAGAVVQSAKLRLFVTNDSTGGGNFYSITNTTWAESITWNTKPSIDGPQRASLGAVALNTFVDIDLTSAITGNGSYSFAIVLPSSNGNTVGYASREATAANRPQLSITIQ